MNINMTDESLKSAHITIFPRGPMKIEGAFELKNANDCLIETPDEVYLCRCGHSKHKPFCDHTHLHVIWPYKDSF